MTDNFKIKNIYKNKYKNINNKIIYLLKYFTYISMDTKSFLKSI